jgi:hypothetical protein
MKKEYGLNSLNMHRQLDVYVNQENKIYDTLNKFVIIEFETKKD